MFMSELHQEVTMARASNLMCLLILHRAGIRFPDDFDINTVLSKNLSAIDNEKMFFCLLEKLLSAREIIEIGELTGSCRYTDAYCYLVEDPRLMQLSQLLAGSPLKEPIFKHLLSLLKKMVELWDDLDDLTSYRHEPLIAGVDLVWDQTGHYSHIYLQLQPGATFNYCPELKYLIAYHKAINRYLDHAKRLAEQRGAVDRWTA